MGLSIYCYKVEKVNDIESLDEDDCFFLNLEENKPLEIFKDFIFEKECTDIKTIEKCVYGKEIGYQRNGANLLFYLDGIWDSDCIVDRETLELHWKKYFSENEDYKKSFKENILDVFVEDECFVNYC
jgi:hypothetical protein